MNVSRAEVGLPQRLLKFLLREMRALFILLLGSSAIVMCTTPAIADSRARIVRLSELEGDVQIDRAVGQGFEKAVMNLPITEGTKLRAGYDGFAEVEFEDGSTVRFTPGTSFEISRLTLLDSGNKATTVNVLGGVLYVNYEGAKNDEFLLTFADETVPLARFEHIRLEVGHTKARLSVMNGAPVQASGPPGTTEIEKKRAVTFAMDGQTPPSPETKVANVQYDDWDERQFQYHERYAKNGKYRQSPYAFGLSDLNYFGYFATSSVCGLVWRPYFASASWDPFANGSWFWFSNFGYSWVSSYPWGWMPYHFGSWQMCPDYGWSWQPGGTWTGLNNCIHRTRLCKLDQIYHPERESEKRTASKNPALFPIQDVTSARTLAIRRDSGGLGIPRGSIPNLREMSRQVERHGSVNALVYASPGSVQEIHVFGIRGEQIAVSRQGSGSQSAFGNSPHGTSVNTNSASSGSHASQATNSSSSAKTSSGGSSPK